MAERFIPSRQSVSCRAAPVIGTTSPCARIFGPAAARGIGTFQLTTKGSTSQKATGKYVDAWKRLVASGSSPPTSGTMEIKALGSPKPLKYWFGRAACWTPQLAERRPRSVSLRGTHALMQAGKRWLRGRALPGLRMPHQTAVRCSVGGRRRRPTSTLRQVAAWGWTASAAACFGPPRSYCASPSCVRRSFPDRHLFIYFPEIRPRRACTGVPLAPWPLPPRPAPGPPRSYCASLCASENSLQGAITAYCSDGPIWVDRGVGVSPKSLKSLRSAQSPRRSAAKADLRSAIPAGSRLRRK